ncbi:ABC transporter ATP-binding protein [Gynuella sunshinyii]|nr:sn-glycerol-3-phosphate ABC transporter ATP-binding protein UgpC [Gynuella sunshinyii]
MSISADITNMAAVELKNIAKSYGRTAVLENINIEINEGDFVVLVGPSGCGKSTLLRMLAGLEKITSGELLMSGQQVNDWTPSERGIAMVFQSYALYPHMTVYRNMAFGLKVAKQGKAEIDHRIRKAAAILKIDHLLQRLPRELSGGQRQRVAIGRAIVRQPRLFLFDEPLSNLDAALRIQTRLEIARLHHQLSATMVYVTHDQVEAMTLGNKIVVLSDGCIQQAGSPLELYQQPANRFVATFIGSPTMNLLSGEIVAISEQSCRVKLECGSVVEVCVDAHSASIGDKVEVGIRSEHIAENSTLDQRLYGKVAIVEHLGEANFIYLTLADGRELTLRGDGNRAIHIGTEMTVSMTKEAFHLFNAEGQAFRRLKPGNMETSERNF